MSQNDNTPMQEGEYEMTYNELFHELAEGARVAMMVRHAERPQIDRNDPTFGETLALTPAGEEEAFKLGRSFRAFASEAEFHSSPMNRTRATARGIAAGMGIEEDEVREWEELGNGSFYFTDQRALFEAFKGRNIYHMMNDWLHGQSLAGLGDMREATDRLEEWIDAHRSSRFAVFATHDLYNAAFLTVRGAAEFTAERWFGFLESAAIIDRPDGSRQYAYVQFAPTSPPDDAAKPA